MKKKLLTLLLALGLILFAVGCNTYHAYKDYYSNPNDYHRTWNLAGFYHGDEDISPLFPKNLTNLEITDYFCRYDQQLPLGEGIQLFLEVQYADPLAFDEEVNRITSLTRNGNDAFSQPNWDAYVLRLCEELASEYAFVDPSGQVIRYIYLRNIPKSEIEIDRELLPDGYTGYGELRGK